jgi:single-strand DNA-binding protein
MAEHKYKFTGVVKVIYDEQTFASGFNKRAFVVVEEDGKYPQEVKFECVKDKVPLVDKLKVNERVAVDFDIRGNEYSGNHYVNLAAWKVESLGQAAPKVDPADEVLDEEPPF